MSDPRTRPARGERANKPAAVGDDTAQVAAARTRARRRLVGALVLLAIGVVGFPVLFETEPRPLPTDTPIEVVRRDAPRSSAAVPEPPPPAAGRATAPPPEAVAVVEPVAPSGAAAGDPVTADASRPAGAPGTQTAVDPPATTSRPSMATSDAPTVPPVASATASAVAPDVRPPGARPGTVPAPTGAASRPAATVVARNSDGERALALLQGGSGGTGGAAAADATARASASGTRFIVQVGAYNDPAALRDARSRVEGMGLKTYVQTVETTTGRRTRVRIGPYASRDEADAAAARVRRGGLPVIVVAL